MEKTTVYINNPVSEKEGNEPLLVLHLLPNVQAAIDMKITHYLEPVEGYFMTVSEYEEIEKLKDELRYSEAAIKTLMGGIDLYKQEVERLKTSNNINSPS